MNERVDKSIADWIIIAEKPKSIPEELDKDWERWVTTPCYLYPLAPRHARAILEIVGRRMAQGVRIETILKDILK